MAIRILILKMPRSRWSAQTPPQWNKNVPCVIADLSRKCHQNPAYVFSNVDTRQTNKQAHSQLLTLLVSNGESVSMSWRIIFLLGWESVSKEGRDHFFHMMDYSNTFYRSGTLRKAFVYRPHFLGYFNTFYWLGTQWWIAYSYNYFLENVFAHICWKRSIQMIITQSYLAFSFIHDNDVIMDTMASQITSLTIVYSTVYSGADQRKHHNGVADQRNIKALRHWPLCGEFTGHRWIPPTKGQ